MNIEVLLTEAEIAAEFAESMEARDLPEKFFYWTPFSVHAWQEVSAITNESLRETWDTLALEGGGPDQIVQRPRSGDQLRSGRRIEGQSDAEGVARGRPRHQMLSGGLQPDDARNGLCGRRGRRLRSPGHQGGYFQSRAPAAGGGRERTAAPLPPVRKYAGRIRSHGSAACMWRSACTRAMC